LRQPIVFEEKQYQEFMFREVTLQDLALVQEEGEGVDTMVKIFSNMSGGVPGQVFLQLPTPEWGVLNDFFIECMKDLQGKA